MIGIEGVLGLEEAAGNRIYERGKGPYGDLSKRENFRLWWDDPLRSSGFHKKAGRIL